MAKAKDGFEPKSYAYKDLVHEDNSVGLSAPPSAVSPSFPAATSNLYIYTNPTRSLDLPIRILTLFPGQELDTIQGKISHRIDENYEALSYCWGSGDGGTVQILESDDSMSIIKIHQNLATALRHLRFPNRPRKLWIDAICINQSNKKEKSFQISIMERIYQTADNVCVWLGNSDSRTDLAFELIDDILKLKEFQNLVTIERSSHWRALIELMKRDWFSRRWIVQEIAYARQATIHCGSSQRKWPDLADAVALLDSRRENLADLFQTSPPYNSRSDFLSDVEALGANRLVQVVSKLFRKSDDGQRIERLLSLEAIVSHLSSFKASNYHDIIYAVLSLAEGTIPSARSALSTRTGIPIDLPGEEELGNRIRNNKRVREIIGELQYRVESKTLYVDYDEKDFFDVFKDFIGFTIRRSRSLDMLCRPWAPNEKIIRLGKQHDLPSWMCRLSNSPHAQRADGRYLRVYADLLVGLPGHTRRPYSAAASTESVLPEFAFSQDKNKIFSLFVDGFVLDEITEVNTPAIEGNIPYEWLETVGWTDFHKEPQESFWRTLVADRDGEGRNPPSYYRRACQHVFAQCVPGGSLNTDTLARNESSDIVKNYLRRLQSVVWMRRLVKTRRKEIELGLAPNQTRLGDYVCIFRGCSVPMIVRPIVDAPRYLINKQIEKTPAKKPKLGNTQNAEPSLVEEEQEEITPNLVRVGTILSKPDAGPEGEARYDPLGPTLPEHKGKKQYVLPCTLIGECYMHGMMDGQAFKFKERIEHQDGVFEIM